MLLSPDSTRTRDLHVSPLDVIHMTPDTTPQAEASAERQAGVASDLTVGLDIGGTKTHGVIWRDGAIVAEARAGSANVQNTTTAGAMRNIATLFRELQYGHKDTDLARAQVIVGAGGVDTPADAERLRGLIAPHVHGAPIEVVHDTRLILAAEHLTTGIAVIAGTGSAAWGIDEDGQEARTGGWGYLLGDVSGHAKLPIGGQGTAHRRPVELPVGGHEICPLLVLSPTA